MVIRTFKCSAKKPHIAVAGVQINVCPKCGKSVIEIKSTANTVRAK